MLDELKKQLREKGFRVTSRKRRLKHRDVVYLSLDGPGGHWEFHNKILPLIRESFNSAYLTSGGFMSLHMAHADPSMEVTVNLTGRDTVHRGDFNGGEMS